MIVPACNEAAALPETLRIARGDGHVEIIVVDGGSRDATRQIAEAHGARVLRTERGRARQMNAGRAAATGEVLLFLHADTQLPADYARHVRETLDRPGVVAGAFRLRIDGPDTPLRIIERMRNLRARCLQMPYGDQAIFLRAETFDLVGGFPELPIMEDFELMRRLRRRGRIGIAPSAVLTSARRWKSRGPWRSVCLNQLVVACYLLGVSPTRLATWYAGDRR